MSHGRALFQAHIAVFFMGIAGVVATLAGFDPWLTTSYRVTFGGIVLVLVWFARGDRRLPTWRRGLLYGALGFLLSVHWFAFFYSLELLGVMLGSAMLGLQPLIIALIAALFLKEKLARRMIVAMLISSVGFVFLGFDHQAGPNLLYGIFWAVIGYVLFGILVVANRRLVRHDSPLVLTTCEMIGAIPLALFMAPGPWLPQSPMSWAYALLLGLLCTGLAYALYNGSMKVLSAPVAGLLLSLEVAYGIIGGRLIGDHLSAGQWVAVLLISNILIVDLVIHLRALWIRRSAVTPRQETT